MEALEDSAHQLTNDIQAALGWLEIGQPDKAMHAMRLSIAELHRLTLEIAARTTHCEGCVELHRVAAKLAAELGKEEIGGLYFRSLGNAETRKTHAALVGWTTPRVSPEPSTHELELDFTCWYGGVRDIVRAIDPNASLPALKEMVVYISENFDRVKAAIAA